MTDLTSKLADALVELINSKPRSPTKEEIVAVLRRLTGTEALASYPGILAAQTASLESLVTAPTIQSALDRILFWDDDKHAIDTIYVCPPDKCPDSTHGKHLWVDGQCHVCEAKKP